MADGLKSLREQKGIPKNLLNQDPKDKNLVPDHPGMYREDLDRPYRHSVIG